MLSSVVEKNIVLTTGKVKDSSYISREFGVSGSSTKVYLDIKEPNGSEVEVWMQKADGTFMELVRDPLLSRHLGDGLVENCFVKEQLNIHSTRIKIVLKNNNSNRAMAKNLRAIIN